MKKLFVLVLAVFMCVSMAACGQKDGAESDAPSTSGTTDVGNQRPADVDDMDASAEPEVTPIVPSGNDGRYGIFDRRYSNGSGPVELEEPVLVLENGASNEDMIPGYGWFSFAIPVSDSGLSVKYKSLGVFAMSDIGEMESFYSAARDYVTDIESALRNDYSLTFNNPAAFNTSGFPDGPSGANGVGVEFFYEHAAAGEGHLFDMTVRGVDGWQQITYSYMCEMDEDGLSRLDDMDASSMLELANSLTGISISTGDVRLLLDEVLHVREVSGRTNHDMYVVDVANTETMDTVSVFLSEVSDGVWQIRFVFCRNIFAG